MISLRSMLHASTQELLQSLTGCIAVSDHEVTVQHGERLKRELIDALLENALFNPELAVRSLAHQLIKAIANDLGIFPTSLQALYEARRRTEYLGKTVPRLAAHGLTYDMARAAFRTMKRSSTAICLFELPVETLPIAESHLQDFCSSVLAAAIKEGFYGPLFLQLGDIRYQADAFINNPQQYHQQLHQLLQLGMANGFLNFAVDTTALPHEGFAEMASFSNTLNEWQQGDRLLAHGAALGDLPSGEAALNSLCANLDTYFEHLKKEGNKAHPLCKLGVKIKGDLANSRVAVEKLRDLIVSKYAFAGLTIDHLLHLSERNLRDLATWQALEVNVSELLYDRLFDSHHFPKEIIVEMRHFLTDACRHEWHVSESEEEFVHRLRHRTFAPFKKMFWEIPAATREKIGLELERTFASLFQWLGVTETVTLVRDKVRGYPLTVQLRGHDT